MSVVARIVPFLAAAILTGAASAHGQVRGTYLCAAEDGPPQPCLTFKLGGKVAINGGLVGTVEASYAVEGRRVKITQAGVTFVYPIDARGCIDGGMMFGWACKAGVVRPSAPSTSTDVCALLPKADVEAIVGISIPVAQLDRGSFGGDPVIKCIYGDPQDPPPVTLSVQVLDSPAIARRELASVRSDATRAVAVYDVDTVSDLGDDALWRVETFGSTLFVVVQKFLVRVEVLRMYEQDRVSNKVIARRVAEKLLPKLPGAGASVGRRPPDPDSTMKADLRNLVTAEEAYFADSLKYTTNLGRLFVSSPGVTTPVIRLTTGPGWSATVRHEASDRSCVVFVGTTPWPPATKEGQPACQ